MGKITKHAEFMETLQTMISKEASGPAKSTGAADVTGKPGADTHYQSVPKETEHVDKNKEGHPEHNPQEFKQEKGHKEGDITGKGGKTAEATKEAAAVTPPDTKAPAAAKEDSSTTISQTEQKKMASAEAPAHEKLAQLGEQLLAAISEMQKSASGPAKSTGAADVTGKPGADTHYQSVSKEHEKVDKNKEGKPENNPQEFKQEKGHKEKDITGKGGKTAEELELDKEASFALGREFARSYLSKTASVEAPIYKEAGRRDFEALIAQASAELDTEGKSKQAQISKQAAVEDESLQIKQAEEAGAQYFQQLLKQAQAEEQANLVKSAFEQKVAQINAAKEAAEKKANELTAKIAAYETEKEKVAEEAKLDAKLAQWGRFVVEDVITRLKNEPVK
jgi:hypothetical protein